MLTLEKIIAYLKVDLKFAWCWPLPMKATKFQKIREMIYRLLFGLNCFLLSISLIYTLIHTLSNESNENYLEFLIKTGCATSIFSAVPVKLLLFTFQRFNLQTIIYEMEDYIQQAKSEEKSIFQQYITKHKIIYIMIICWTTISNLTVIFGPFLLSQPFPIEVEYPFNVNKQPLKTIIFLHQVIAIYQVREHVCTNVFIALLLWFVAGRFEILSHKFQKITNISEFIICVQLHQRLLRYAKDVTTTVRYIALSTVGFSTIVVVFGGLTFLSRQSFTVKAQFFIVDASALLEVYLCALPADYLMNMSNDVGHAVYESSWYNKEISLQKDVVFMISRCQHPVTLTIPCMLPTLSLAYFASYLSTTFSYLTTFRAVFTTED